MIRGFVTGLILGGVMAGTGLAVLSQLSPLPKAAPSLAADTTSAPQAKAAAPETPAAEAPAAEAPAGSAPSATGLAAAPSRPAQPSPAPQLQPPAPAPSQTPSQVPAAAPPSPAQPPAGIAAPEAADPTAILPQSAEVTPNLPKRITMDNAAEADRPANPPAADLTAPKAPPAVQPTSAPDGTAQTDLLSAAPATTDAPLPGAAPDPDQAAPSPAKPRLIVPDGKPLTQRLPSPALPGAADTPPPVATPLALFARPFDNPEKKPVMAILLVDDGRADLDRQTLAALPFPVTFAINPLAPNAAEAAAIYRKAGQEVVMIADAIPPGAKPADLEQTMQTLDLALPEAVAVMGRALSGSDAGLAASMVPIISAQGRGIVTSGTGLNAVAQVARREAVPSAPIFRILDGLGETIPVIRRYLDRAAFRAGQEGSVIVQGSTAPDTIAALLQWTVEGRAAGIALAPVSAVLSLAD